MDTTPALWLVPQKDCISVFEPPQSETPSTKAQAPEKFQSPKHQTQKPILEQTAGRLVFELGAFGLGSQPLKNRDSSVLRRAQNTACFGGVLFLYCPLFWNES